MDSNLGIQFRYVTRPMVYVALETTPQICAHPKVYEHDDPKKYASC